MLVLFMIIMKSLKIKVQHNQQNKNQFKMKIIIKLYQYQKFLK